MWADFFTITLFTYLWIAFYFKNIFFKGFHNHAIDLFFVNTTMTMGDTDDFWQRTCVNIICIVIKVLEKNNIIHYKWFMCITSLGSDTPASQSPSGLILLRVKLPGVWYSGESITLGSDTPTSQAPQGLILLHVKLPWIWYCWSQAPWGLILR